MARYADISDCSDPALSVSELNLQDADVYVDLALGKRLAAIEGAMGDNSLLIDKAKQYQANAEGLAKSLNRSALGLADPVGAGFGSFTMGRG